MKTYLKIALAISLWTVWALWRVTNPPMLQMITGRPDEKVLEFLRSRGAQYQVTQHGFRIAADPTGFDCLYTLMRHHQFAMDICSENIANANTCKTADGTPYRRKFAVLTGDGQSRVEQDRGDFRWVYDPTNPDSEQEGIHHGYLACPNINVEMEKFAFRQHQQMLRGYSAALGKIEAMHNDLVVIRPSDWDQEAPEPQLFRPSPELQR